VPGLGVLRVLLFLTQFLQVVWGYSPLKGGLAYLPFIGAFIVMAGISSKLVSRVGARPLMMLGAVIAPVGLFWLSRVHPGSHYLTGVALPLVVFAMAAGLIFVPLTVTLVAGVSDEDSGVASSMFNAGQQVGGSLGLAVIGSVAWTVVNDKLRSAAHPGYGHALASGVTSAMMIGACAGLAALIITFVAIRVRREDLPDGMVVM
jgi:MFS family permease